MILIRFPNTESKRTALARLAGRFNFTSWASGEMLVPGDALAFLAAQGIPFTSAGPDAFVHLSERGEAVVVAINEQPPNPNEAALRGAQRFTQGHG